MMYHKIKEQFYVQKVITNECAHEYTISGKVCKDLPPSKTINSQPTLSQHNHSHQLRNSLPVNKNP